MTHDEREDIPEPETRRAIRIPSPPQYLALDEPEPLNSYGEPIDDEPSA